LFRFTLTSIYSNVETKPLVSYSWPFTARARNGQRTKGEEVASTTTNIFGATSTTEDVLSGIDLQGRRILVTGVSAGLGVETARSLAAHGAQVIGAARDLAKAEKATAEVRKDATAGGGSFELVDLDLASLKSVGACADGLLAKGESLDVIIANAGVMATPLGYTADGF
jgi:3-oxoacyl-ACP reductase-like protein